MSARKPRGYVIYRGPSLLDGRPIVAVAITKSKNTKTSNMVQTYIVRADIDPRDASRTGEDYSICGTCPHRGTPQPDKASGLAKGRSCYVVIGQGPVIVYKSLQRGIYPAATSHKAIALQAIAGGTIPRERMAREPDEPLARWQDRNAYTLLAWMQETARKALENDDKR